MNAFLTITLGLIVSASLRPHTQLYNGIGDLNVDQQLIRSLSPIRISEEMPVKVEAYGGGRGDLDCYLLEHATNGWVILAKDESNLDQCDISYAPTNSQDLRLWVVNHGVHSTHYIIHVEQ